MMVITARHQTDRLEHIHRPALQIQLIVPAVREAAQEEAPAAVAVAVDPDPTGDDKILFFSDCYRGIFREPIKWTDT